VTAGAGTETPFSTIRIPAALLNTARRTIRIKGHGEFTANAGGSTADFHLRLGGNTPGTSDLLHTSAGIAYAVGEMFSYEAELQVRVIGAAATAKFAGHLLFSEETTPAYGITHLDDTGTNFTTNADQYAMISIAFSAAATDAATLKHFEVEILGE